MKLPRDILVAALFIGVSATFATAETPKEARVTQIIREVKLLPSNADERDAMVEDKVAEDTGVRTGLDSRSELTFADLTITRLGANTIFSFNKAGRTVNLNGGSVLLRVPKDSGGATIRHNVVTVAITGTTLILETTPDGASRLITLEGTARLSFTKHSRQSRRVAAGQMLDVKAGAMVLPMPTDIDLGELMRTHPLIVGFQPLPSLPLIMAAVKNQPAPPTSNRPPVVTSPTTNPTPRPIIAPSPSPTPAFSPTPRPARSPRPERTPKPTPKPTPKETPNPSPTPKATPKPTPKSSPKPTKPPRVDQTDGGKPPVVDGNPSPSPTPVILKKAPGQTTNSQSPTATPRYRKTTKKTAPSGPR